jgi:hypothetical protein
MLGDAFARVESAFNILYSRDPHLAAIGFQWPPLPTFFDLPFVALKGLWPQLTHFGFAGSIMAAAFSAGTVVLLNRGLRWAGVVRGMRWVICLMWTLNPMIVLYAAQGMSEAPFMFFFVGSILVFLAWSENRRASLLPLLGVLAGGAALCRDEALVLAFVMGICVVVQSWRHGDGWRKVETEALMYGLPAILVISLWLGTATVLFHDPLYVLHVNGINLIPAAAPAGRPAAGLVGQAVLAREVPGGILQFNLVTDAIRLVFTHVMLLYPAVVALVTVVMVRLLTKPNRAAGICLLMLGITIPAEDVHLLSTGLGPVLRYQIFVIPFTFLLAVYVLRSVRGRRSVLSSGVALALAVVLGLSNVITALDLGDSNLAPEEAPVASALINDKPLAPSGYGPFETGPQIVAQLLKLDNDNGLILCDSLTCYTLNIAAPDPRLFVVTSDRDFEAAAAQPRTHGVEYFLVPEPQGRAALDRLNMLYPTLWQNGARFAKLVGSGPGGGYETNWRLYRITGPTGIGLAGH